MMVLHVAKHGDVERSLGGSAGGPLYVREPGVTPTR
jgi:hypothetical protein